jgi:HAD superfamily hydrolase (TIGR01509 family)
MPSAEQLDAVTVDAFGTVVELGEPYDRLGQALAERGVERSREEVARAFAAEVAHYLPRAHEGRDAESLGRLRRQCAGVFLAGAGASLDPSEFAPAFVDALEFHLLPGAEDALGRLRAAGLVLVCVGNWDVSLADYLRRVGLSHFFATVVSSAEAGAPKPDPRPFELALSRIGIRPERALHVGDSDADRDGARAAGLSFEPVPLVTLPARLGL